MWSLRLRGQRASLLLGGFAFGLKPRLLGNTVGSRGWERFCGQQVVDDLVVPAHGGEEGGIEWRPSSVPHKVSVGAASEPGRGEESVSVAGMGGKHPHIQAHCWDVLHTLRHGYHTPEDLTEPYFHSRRNSGESKSRDRGQAQAASHGQEGRQTDLLSGALHLATGSSSLSDSLCAEGRLPLGDGTPVSEMLPATTPSPRDRAGGEAAPGRRGSTPHRFPHLVPLRETMHFPEKERTWHRGSAPRSPLPEPPWHSHVGQARVQHSQGAVLTDRGQQGGTRRARGREAHGSQDKPQWASSPRPHFKVTEKGPHPHVGLNLATTQVDN